MAKALGVKPELIGITGQNRIPFLTEHKLSLLVSVGVSDERKKVVAFTAPYASYSIDVMGPKSMAVKTAADLSGKSVAVNRGVPPTVGFLVQLIRSTALASIVGYRELTKTAQILTNATFQPFVYL